MRTSLFFAVTLACIPLPALAQTGGAAAQTPPASCNLNEISSLDMSTDPDGRITIPAAVNGHPVRFLVDTGDVFATLSSSVVEELHLAQSASPPQIMAGNVMMQTQVEVDTFQLGRQNGQGLHFVVMPSETLTLNDDGLLGGSIWNNYDIEFDFAHAKFNIFSQDHCRGEVVYWTKSDFGSIPMKMDRDWHIVVPVMLNGKSVTAVLDTGAAHSFMSLEEAKDIFGIDVTDAAMKNLGASSINGAAATQIYRYPFSTLTLQDVTVNNPEIDLMPQSAIFRHGGPQLVLGIGVLRQLHLYVAYGEQVLYVTPAETP